MVSSEMFGISVKYVSITKIYHQQLMHKNQPIDAFILSKTIV